LSLFIKKIKKRKNKKQKTKQYKKKRRLERYPNQNTPPQKKKKKKREDIRNLLPYVMMPNKHFIDHTHESVVPGNYTFVIAHRTLLYFIVVS
jgi:hypothetical protein